jgi:hypothetical protein
VTVTAPARAPHVTVAYWGGQRSNLGNFMDREPWLFRSLVFGSGIRRLDGGRRPPPRKDLVPDGSRAGWRLRRTNWLSSTGDDSRPHHAILDRKIARGYSGVGKGPAFRFQSDHHNMKTGA